MRARFLLPPLLAAVAASGVWAMAGRQDAFPHREHEGLFPLCVGCHAGIETGEESRLYPEPAECAACHDGEREEPVDWAAPARTPSTLEFSHPDHAQLVRAEAGAETPTACVACHREPGATGRMAVQAATAEACLECHEHEAPEHLAEGRECRQCHVPLAQASGVPVERIVDFPRPASHESPDFLQRHDPGGDVARCATCHARESCTRCHMNAETVPAIDALEPDARVAAWVVAFDPEYPEPGSHEDPAWSREHAEQARAEPGQCANCHVQANCRSCHVDAAPAGLASLPAAPAGERRGVQTVEIVAVHIPGYARQHGTSAALEAETCASCHATTFCEACHDGPASPAFHLPNFLERHAPEAYARETDCSACHNTEVFCRACHSQAGLGSQGNVGVAFHSARPFWLLGHATAARQGLEGCVTCHTQTDCAQCHSAVGGWRINPHGPGFDAGPAREANPFSCLRCHRREILR
ncbi:MAG TPA: cytochrome c3 family protein [Longimicrobiales bacterium]|nr:cytochrome c3 family protein [Longimicrobiales bacterium]